MDRIKKNQPTQIYHNHQGMRGKLTIPLYSGFYDGEKYFDWKMAVEQEFNSHLVPEKHTPCSFELFSQISSHPALFFSHNKPANSTFSHNKPAK
jgi:hypothetical protein